MTRTWRNIASALGLLALCAIVSTPAHAQKGGGTKSGTTLAASKTLDICTVSDNGTPLNLADDTWRYSGDISVWNEGVIATSGLTITDCIQKKGVNGKFTDFSCQGIPATEIPAGTTLATATVFPYSFDLAAILGDIRNAVAVKILNHSGSLGKPTGPEPKATYSGDFPPPLCEVDTSCVNTQGYWGNKPGVIWPSPYDRAALFYNSGLTFQDVLNTPPGGNGYIILAQQYIAAVLNQARGEDVPSGVQDIIDLSNTFFTSTSTPSAACPLNSSCGLQKTWGGILDNYNNGIYPGGPAHCEEVVEP
jgi:hypothetical protein